jgi:ABC-type multidrug transport system fused ATPase/permease subunit
MLYSAGTLKGIFFKHWRSLTLTYSLTFLENLFELLYPFAIGVAINGLLEGTTSSVLLLILTWLAHLGVGTFRHLYDTRTFTRIYSDLATSVVLGQRKQGVSDSQIVARSALSREFVTFFERDVPLVFNSVFGFFGALIMLFIYDWQISVYCLVLLIPLLVLNQIFARKSLRLNEELNNQLEREVEVLTAQNEDSVRSHYQLLGKWRIKLSNAEAGNWSVMELFVIGLALAVLFRTVSLPNIQTGDIYAIISYLWNYIGSLDNVPSLVQQLSRLRDIGKRMQIVENAEGEAVVS